MSVLVDEGMRLDRLTTIGTGGMARAFSRPTTVVELEKLSPGPQSAPWRSS